MGQHGRGHRKEEEIPFGEKKKLQIPRRRVSTCSTTWFLGSPGKLHRTVLLDRYRIHRLRVGGSNYQHSERAARLTARREVSVLRTWRGLSVCSVGTHVDAGFAKRVEMSLDPAGKSACATSIV